MLQGHRQRGLGNHVAVDCSVGSGAVKTDLVRYLCCFWASVMSSLQEKTASYVYFGDRTWAIDQAWLSVGHETPRNCSLEGYTVPEDFLRKHPWRRSHCHCPYSDSQSMKMGHGRTDSSRPQGNYQPASTYNSLLATDIASHSDLHYSLANMASQIMAKSAVRA